MASSEATQVAFIAERYRTFWCRFWAGMIDGVVITIPFDIAEHFIRPSSRGVAIQIVWLLLTSSCAWIYSVILHWRYGQTVGKRLLDIKVLDVSELRLPTFRQAFLRDIGESGLGVTMTIYLIYLLSTHQYVVGGELHGLVGAILGWTNFGWFLLEIATMFSNAKRRALHDWIAGTVVVHGMEILPTTAPEISVT